MSADGNHIKRPPSVKEAVHLWLDEYMANPPAKEPSVRQLLAQYFGDPPAAVDDPEMPAKALRIIEIFAKLDMALIEARDALRAYLEQYQQPSSDHFEAIERYGFDGVATVSEALVSALAPDGAGELAWHMIFDADCILEKQGQPADMHLFDVLLDLIMDRILDEAIKGNKRFRDFCQWVSGELCNDH